MSLSKEDHKVIRTIISEELRRILAKITAKASAEGEDRLAEITLLLYDCVEERVRELDE